MDSQKAEIIFKKEKIRKEIIRLLQGMDSLAKKGNDLKIQEKVLSSKEFNKSDTVMTYVSLPSEVDTWGIIKEALKRGKRVVVPFLGGDKKQIIASKLSSIECMKNGPFDIFQPENGWTDRVPLEEIDLILVPAIAFDSRNMRLGRGKGYYDKFLSQKELSSVTAIGLAYNFQVLKNLPSDVHDKSVLRVITN